MQTVSVSAYPIPMEIMLEGAAAPVQASILKLTDVGLIAKTDGKIFLKTGENVKASFTLKVSNYTVQSDCKVIKTYDALELVKGKPLVQESLIRNNMVELHFVELQQSARNKIKEFLARIKQV